MKLTKLIQHENELLEWLNILNKEYEIKKSEINSALKITRQSINFLNSALDLDLIKLAESVIYVEGDASKEIKAHNSNQGRDGVRANCIRSAIDDLVSGGQKMKKEYFGVKNYDHFGDQRHDCSYGMGPTHGSIVFRIGRKIKDRELTPEEIEASIYYLTHIKRIQENKKVA